MKTLKTLKTWAAVAAMLAFTSVAQAALVSQSTLVSQGDGTVKDTKTNLIWLQNWNVNGAQNWDAQMAWADNLVFAGSGDWHLPSYAQYRSLFVTYGNLTNVSAFTNVMPDFYWINQEFSPSPTFAMQFRPVNSESNSIRKATGLYGVAVRSADVTTSVPEPQSLALVLLALGAAALTRKKRPA